MIILRRAVNKQFYFIFQAKNGKTLVHSENYITKQAAIKGILAIVNVLKPSLIWKASDLKKNKQFKDETI